MSNNTYIELPFNGKWYTFNGGDTEELNNHHLDDAQKYAFDFVIHNSRGNSFDKDGLINEDYYAYGKDILAPASGTIIEAVIGVRDNRPGVTNKFAVGGNYLLIEHSKKQYSFIAHLRNDSTLVRAGDSVKLGQKLGECGNSGNSAQPHIHYHLQNSATHSRIVKGKTKPVALGIKVYFSSVSIEQNGKQISRQEYSPVQGDYIKSSKST